MTDLVACFSRHLDRRVRFDQEDESTWATECAEQLGEAETEALASLWRRANAYTEEDISNIRERAQTAKRLLDRSLTTLTSYLAAGM